MTAGAVERQGQVRSRAGAKVPTVFISIDIFIIGLGQLTARAVERLVRGRYRAGALVPTAKAAMARAFALDPTHRLGKA